MLPDDASEAALVELEGLEALAKRHPDEVQRWRLAVEASGMSATRWALTALVAEADRTLGGPRAGARESRRYTG